MDIKRIKRKQLEIMRTGSEKNYVYYDWSNEISSHYVNGYVVATLNHVTDEFETEIDMTEKDMDYSYSQMIKNKNEYFNQ